MKILKILSLMIIIASGIVAQDTISYNMDSLSGKIYLIGKNDGDKITLRWAPGSPGVWQLSNKAGYMLERLSYRDTSDFLGATFKLLTPTPFKPLELEKWEPLVNAIPEDKYAALAAQAIWGKRNKSDPLNTEASMFEKAREFNNLFSTAMLSAEFSANTAIASGLRYEDYDIDTSLTYFYRVYSLVSNLDYPIDTTYLVINGNDIYKNIEVKIDEVFENDREIILSWDREYENYYSGWYIEKSSDGKNYIRLNEDPYIDSPTDDLGIKSTTMTYSDSLEKNYVKYHYRLIGINPFAELSVPSDPVMGMGRDRTPPPAPQNINAKQIAPGKMEITWTMPEICDDLKGFLISRSNEINKNEVAVTNDILPVETRSYIDTTYDEVLNNWYYVYAVDTAGNAMVGLPEYGSINDSIPPSPPVGLTGKIDTNGIVTISWDENTERDIYGYSVFSANQADHTFIIENNIPTRFNSYTDTISLKTLTEHKFFRVAAIDLARNISEFSEILTLKKPDIVPPVPPVFTDYNVAEQGIFLSWVQSTSHDVRTHILYRRTLGAEDWESIYTTDELVEQDEYIDKNAIAGKTYEYKIIAQDDDGLYSPISSILTLTALDFSEITPIEDLEAVFNQSMNKVTLRWSNSEGGEYKYQIFRAVNDGGFYLLNEVKDPVRQISDEVQMGRTYEYTIVVIKNDKKKSGFSKSVKINLTDSDENSK